MSNRQIHTGPDGTGGTANERGKSSIPGSERVPWRRKWLPSPVLLPRKSHEQRHLVGYSLWGFKEPDMTEHVHTHTMVYYFRGLSIYFFLP